MKSMKTVVALALVVASLSGCASMTSAWNSVSDEVSGWFSSSSDSKDAKK